MDRDNRIWWGSDGNQVPAIKRFLSEVQPGLVPETIWTYKEVNHTQGAKKMLLQIFPEELPDFTTKPFELIKRIVLLSTDPDSVVLDAFAGSGTTAHAVLAQNREDGGNQRFILVVRRGQSLFLRDGLCPGIGSWRRNLAHECWWEVKCPWISPDFGFRHRLGVGRRALEFIWIRKPLKCCYTNRLSCR